MAARPGRVLLVNPRICSPRSVRLPLSLLALGAVLEGRYDYRILDGNLDPRALDRALAALDEAPHVLVGLTVMPGPQVAPAIEISKALKARHPEVPIVWGGYFPTLYPQAALAAPYVDYVVRGLGEETLLELLAFLEGNGEVAEIRGLSFQAEDGAAVHTQERALLPTDAWPPLPYERLEAVEPYLRPSFLGRRTGVYQSAVGCRYHCEFCGVVSMFRGKTQLGAAERLYLELVTQRDRYGVTAMQLYDHNFFDREESAIPRLEALERAGLPWWCYARADTLARFSTKTWELIRKSRLAMAYIGAEAASDEVLRGMKKGSKVEHTFEAVRRCREAGVVPELSFVLGGPEDPEGEMERTFRFIKKLKAVHPECEVVLYFYTPTPRRRSSVNDAKTENSFGGAALDLPETPEEWAEPRWVDFVCHRNAPWLSPRLRRRVDDFATVLGCRFPTVQDHRLGPGGRRLLRGLASWRYATGFYHRPWELRLASRALRLREPARESL